MMDKWDADKEFVEKKCSPPIYVVDRGKLIKRKTERTKSCYGERDNRQIVCVERKTKSTTMNRKQWESIKPNYTYFRY